MECAAARRKNHGEVRNLIPSDRLYISTSSILVGLFNWVSFRETLQDVVFIYFWGDIWYFSTYKKKIVTLKKPVLLFLNQDRGSGDSWKFSFVDCYYNVRG